MEYLKFWLIMGVIGLILTIIFGTAGVIFGVMWLIDHVRFV